MITGQNDITKRGRWVNFHYNVIFTMYITDVRLEWDILLGHHVCMNWYHLPFKDISMDLVLLKQIYMNKYNSKKMMYQLVKFVLCSEYD